MKAHKLSERFSRGECATWSRSRVDFSEDFHQQQLRCQNKYHLRFVEDVCLEKWYPDKFCQLYSNISCAYFEFIVADFAEMRQAQHEIGNQRSIIDAEAFQGIVEGNSHYWKSCELNKARKFFECFKSTESTATLRPYRSQVFFSLHFHAYLMKVIE